MITKTYTVSGMTCTGCVETVQKKIEEVLGVTSATVDLEKGSVQVTSEHILKAPELQAALGSKYSITPKQDVMQQPPSKSKLQQLQPLFLIFGYLWVASFLLNYKDWNLNSFMLDFMGLFFIVFSFFKLLDLRGFPATFRMYDPLAKAIPPYAWVYPFLEVGLGLLLLMRIEVKMALIATVVILGITTFGVTRTLVDKKKIKCACLGTALNLPMTEATFIENALMIAMALFMLLNPAAL